MNTPDDFAPHGSLDCGLPLVTPVPAAPTTQPVDTPAYDGPTDADLARLLRAHADGCESRQAWDPEPPMPSLYREAADRLDPAGAAT